ncbi:conserved hypothetical protein, partial [Ricinus communis]
RFVQLRQLQVRFAHHARVAGVRQRLLQVALGLAPQFLLQAQGAQRQRQLGVCRTRVGPVLAMLDLHQQGRRTGRRGGFAVGAHHAVVPVGGQRFLRHQARLVVQAARVQRTGGAACDIRLDAVGARHRRPYAQQRFGIVRRVGQQVVVGQLAQARRQRRVQRAVLVQRTHQAQHFRPVLGLLLRFQRHLQRVDVPRAAGVQFAHGFQRRLRLVVVDQQFGHGHQARGFHRVVVDQLVQPLVAARRLAHAVRRAGADQRGHAGVFRQFGGAQRGLFGVAEAAFEQRLERLAQALVAIALALLLTVGGHLARHLDRGAEGADHD